MKKIYFIISIMILGALAFSGVFEKIDPVRAISTEGLVGWWKMDDNLATTAVVDETGTNNGTLSDAGGDPGATTAVHSAVSLHDRALSFDGTDDYVDCGSDSSLTSTTGSIEIWAKLNTTNADEPLIFIVESTWSDYLRLYRGNGYLKFQIEDGNSYVTNLQGPVNINNTNWHHIVVTQDGSAIKIYIDGINQSLTGTNSTYWTNHLTLTNFYIGKDSWQSSVDGQIDQVRIYNRALSAEEIALHYFLESETRIKNATIKNAEIK